MDLITRASAWWRRLLGAARADASDSFDDIDMSGPLTAWVGRWHTSLDGVYETRARVERHDAGYVPTLEISRLGREYGSDGCGDPDQAVPTLAQAIEIAKRREDDWFTQHEFESARA